MKHRPIRWILLLALMALPGTLLGCPHEEHGLDPRLGPARRGTPPPHTGPSAAVVRRAVETICDRMEDCAVERNVALARNYGGTPADVEAAREQARRALHSGYVRRWCEQRVGSLKPKKIMQILSCRSKAACDPFFQCAALPDHNTGIR